VSDERPDPLHRFGLLVRAVVSLAGAALLVVGIPALLAWWLMGGPFGWRHLLVGLGVALALALVAGLIFGWAVGRVRWGRRE
jgi:hypothetical protein